MLPFTQIDTFYNGLTLRHRDTINAASGGTFMKRRPEECYDLIKNMTAYHNEWDTSAQRSESSSSITSSFDQEIIALKAKMAKINKNLMRVLQVNQQVKAVTPNCETSSGPYSYNDCLTTVGQTQDVYSARSYQGGNSYQPHGNRNFLSYRSENYLGPPGFNQNQNRNNQNQDFQNQDRNQENNHGIPQGNNQGRNQFFQRASHGSNPPPAYQAPASSPRVAEDVFVKVGTFHFSADFVVVDFNVDPRVPLILKRFFLKTERALIDVFEGELTLRVGKEAITLNLDQTSRYSANCNDMTANRIDVIDMACEEYSQEVLAKNDKSSIDELLEVELKDLPPYLEYAFLEGDDKLPVIIAKDLSVEEKSALIMVLKSHKQVISWKLSDIKAKNDKSSIDELLEVELKDLPPHLEYAFLEGEDKLLIIISKDLSVEEKSALIMVLKSHNLWESLVHCVPRKGGFTVVENEENELIPTRLVTGWRVCFDYHKLKEATRKDHFPLSFIDQMLKRLAGNEYYCFLRNSFSTCLSHLEKMLKRCEDTNLCLNWEKSHFMFKEGIFLSHRISKNEIEVDKAKVDVITKLPHPNTVKGIRSFLGHAGFYRRFIQDFSKIA
nr:hypothetical protein [Tanacetum cinerariifolium]